MIRKDEFINLTIASFVDLAAVQSWSHWEFYGQLWECESFGFTEFLRPRDRPAEVHALSVDLRGFPNVAELLDAIDIQLRLEMTESEVEQQLGEPSLRSVLPTEVVQLMFTDVGVDRYRIYCFLNTGRLHGLAIFTKEYGDKNE